MEQGKHTSYAVEERVQEKVNTKQFIEENQYHGELGALYSQEYTEFKVWAPTAVRVELLIYDGYYGMLKNSLLMATAHNGQVFVRRLEGDCHGLTYRYRVHFADGQVNHAVDPYAKATTINGQRSVVVDLSRTQPDNWTGRLTSTFPLEDTVIYELHIRDFTVAPTSGVRRKGKYLGAIETGTRNAAGDTTGIDYLKELGITHVELLPFFDFATVDETTEEHQTYNWGYDPLNYNVPEGSYATNPYDPFCRIKELKQMIQGFHDAGIRVIMDVVYNHVYQYEYHPFHHIVPGYFFRQNADGSLSNGTGVGNDTASERPMMRKFIVDSVKYWANEYAIDGFRFDLMGIHDVDTMNAVRKALDEIDPSIIVFGEGWDLHTPLSFEQKANHHNAPRMIGVGQFNDGLREALKGNDFEASARGFVNGAWYEEHKLAVNVAACEAYHHYVVPQQLIQYVESHDNFTLYDKLKAANPYLDEYTIVKQHELATTIVLLSQGIPFIHAGQEFLRTKQGVRDSYNRPDSINQLDWERRTQYRSTYQYVRDLIKLRQAEPLFCLTNYEAIRSFIHVLRADYQIVAYGLGDYIIVFNAQHDTINFELPQGDYKVIVKDSAVYLDHEPEIYIHQTIDVRAYSALVIKKIK